jgi:capsular exopolysaccharide synthesis family protein
MSRLDEAMRRATGQPVGAATADTVTPGDAEVDVDVLGREPFPHEVPPSERRPPRVEPESSQANGSLVGVSSSERGWTGGPQETRTASGNGNGKDRPLFDRMDARLGEKVVIDEHILPTSREQYRRLAAVLHDAQNASGVKVIMIGSALPGEGKTLTASNLALTFSESYRKRVLLIDADLRRPALHGVFRVDSATGLMDDLSNPGTKLIVRQVSPTLALLPAGRPSSDPMAGLTSARMQQLLAEAKETFDWIILDTPPLALLPDAHLLSSMMDGVVMVIKADSTPHDVIKRCVDSVGRARILGVVLNAAVEMKRGGGYQYDYYGGYRAEGALERQ